MNTLQIQKILERDVYANKYFCGVYPKDKLPKKLNFPSLMVINTDKSNEPGEHWIALYCDKNGKCEFFDSYGLHPDFYNLTNYLNKTCKSWKYNKKCLQGVFSNLCGYYCCLFLMIRSRNYSLKYFLSFYINLFFREGISRYTGELTVKKNVYKGYYPNFFKFLEEIS